MTAAAKDVRSSLGNDLLEKRADVVPPQLYALAVRAWARTRLANHVRPPLNLVLSNVAGPRERLQVGQAVLEAIYSVGPILEGIGLNITAWSYAGDLNVSVLGCPTSVPDPWVITDALHDPWRTSKKRRSAPPGQVDSFHAPDRDQGSQAAWTASRPGYWARRSSWVSMTASTVLSPSDARAA